MAEETIGTKMERVNGIRILCLQHSCYISGIHMRELIRAKSLGLRF